MLLHAGPHAAGKKAYVALAKRDDWNLCSFPVHGGLENYLPNFIETLLKDVLDEDAFCSMNTMFRPGRRYSQHPTLYDVLGPDQRRIMEAHRDANSIARLNACWVDIDCYAIGITQGQAIGAIYDAQRDGIIPSPSYLKDSGRGLWVYWLLGTKTRSYPEDVALWRQCQTKLANLFALEGSDFNSGNDPARLSRIVGSLNSKSNKRATMLVFAKDASGQPIRYDLAELAKALNVDTETKRRPRLPTTKTTNSQKGYQGQFLRWKYDEERFWVLLEMRGKLAVGTRNACHLVIGSILRHRHRDPMQLEEAITESSHRVWRYHPRTDSEYNTTIVRRQIQHAATRRQRTDRITSQAIANLLHVTTEEAEAIRKRVVTKRNASWPPMKGQPPLPKQKLSRHEIKEAVLSWCRSHKWFPTNPSDQAVTDLLAEETGIELSRNTVRRYRKQLSTTTKKTTSTLF